MSDRYIPALGFAWLTSIYDPVVRWTTREATFKSRLVGQADIRAGHRVLDLGCGTGTLTMMLKRHQPAAAIIGIDGDPEVLEIATRKARAANVEVALDRGTVDHLPYSSSSFDRVVSSLVFHHLSRDKKRAALHELVRVLRPGGQLHIADWGQPHVSTASDAAGDDRALPGGAPRMNARPLFPVGKRRPGTLMSKVSP